jgi:hypothetical protein
LTVCVSEEALVECFSNALAAESWTDANEVAVDLIGVRLGTKCRQEPDDLSV